MSATRETKPASAEAAASQPTAAAASTAPAFTPDDKTPLRFTKSFSRYHRGDVAGFPPRYAQQLIEKGVAVPWQPPAQSRAVDEMVRK